MYTLLLMDETSFSIVYYCGGREQRRCLICHSKLSGLQSLSITGINMMILFGKIGVKIHVDISKMSARSKEPPFFLDG